MYELVYTSAPRGLIAGRSGFSTVAMTAGFPPNLISPIENMSGYRNLFPPGHPDADRNPVNYSCQHYRWGGTLFIVLSKISYAGLSFTGRTNVLAHHLLFTPEELASIEGGATAVLRCPENFPPWSGEPRELPLKNPRHVGRAPAADPGLWAKLAGDENWAAYAADRFRTDPKHGWVFAFDPLKLSGEALLDLIDSVTNRLSPEEAMGFTFCTYCTSPAITTSLSLRGYPEGSPQLASVEHLTPECVIKLGRNNPIPGGWQPPKPPEPPKQPEAPAPPEPPVQPVHLTILETPEQPGYQEPAAQVFFQTPPPVPPRTRASAPGGRDLPPEVPPQAPAANGKFMEKFFRILGIVSAAVILLLGGMFLEKLFRSSRRPEPQNESEETIRSASPSAEEDAGKVRLRQAGSRTAAQPPAAQPRKSEPRTAPQPRKAEPRTAPQPRKAEPRTAPQPRKSEPQTGPQPRKAPQPPADRPRKSEPKKTPAPSAGKSAAPAAPAGTTGGKPPAASRPAPPPEWTEDLQQKFQFHMGFNLKRKGPLPKSFRKRSSLTVKLSGIGASNEIADLNNYYTMAGPGEITVYPFEEKSGELESVKSCDRSSPHVLTLKLTDGCLTVKVPSPARNRPRIENIRDVTVINSGGKRFSFSPNSPDSKFIVFIKRKPGTVRVRQADKDIPVFECSIDVSDEVWAFRQHLTLRANGKAVSGDIDSRTIELPVLNFTDMQKPLSRWNDALAKYFNACRELKLQGEEDKTLEKDFEKTLTRVPEEVNAERDELEKAIKAGKVQISKEIAAVCEKLPPPRYRSDATVHPIQEQLEKLETRWKELQVWRKKERLRKNYLSVLNKVRAETENQLRAVPPELLGDCLKRIRSNRKVSPDFCKQFSPEQVRKAIKIEPEWRNDHGTNSNNR